MMTLGSTEEMDSCPSGPLRAATCAIRHLSLYLAIVVLGVSVAGAGEESGAPLPEYQVQAEYLIDFTKYVKWPSGALGSPTNTFVIGVLGKDPFGSTLDAIVAGKTVAGRPISIRRFVRVEDVRACRVLFISRSEAPRLTNDLARLHGRSVLTVSDAEGFLEYGGQIQFVTEDNSVKFDVNLEATRHSRLKLDANLLRVARLVKGHGERAWRRYR